MHITSRQIRAARALLNWSQKQLAHAAGLSYNTLNNIERDTANPRPESLKSLKDVMEHAGVEFLDGDGVRMRGEAVDIEQIEGEHVLDIFYSDFLKALPMGNGEVLYNGIDNTRFEHKSPQKLMAFKNTEKEMIRRNIKERLIFREGDTNFLSSSNVYRWVPKELFGEIPHAIYGNNVGIILWGPPLKLIIIRNKAIAETFRKQFDMIWKVAKRVPEEIYKKHRVTESEIKKALKNLE